MAGLSETPYDINKLGAGHGAKVLCAEVRHTYKQIAQSLEKRAGFPGGTGAAPGLPGRRFIHAGAWPSLARTAAPGFRLSPE